MKRKMIGAIASCSSRARKPRLTAGIAKGLKASSMKTTSILTSIAWLASAALSSASHYQVYLLGGQSNGVGRGDAAQLTAPLNAPQTDVLFYWHRTQDATNTGHLLEDQWIDLAPGSGLGTGEPVYPMEFGSEVSFGRAMADAKPTENIAFIKYAHGGTTLGRDWAPSGAKYAAFVSTVRAGLAALTAAGHTYELKGMLWMQGETDTKSSTYATAYEANLISLIARVRADVFSGGSLPFVIGSLSDNQLPDLTTPGSGSYKVRQAQEAVAAADAKVGIVITDGYSVRSDVIHFDHTSQIALGQGFVTEMLVLEGPDMAAPQLSGTNPANGAANVSIDNNLVATFDENIALTGAGTVTIRDLGLGPDIVITLPNAQVSASGNALTIAPAVDLLPENSYAIQISAAAIVDQAATPNAFGGISNDTTWSFSTIPAGFTIMNTTAASFTVSTSDLLQTSLASVSASDLTDINSSGITLTGESTLRDGVWDNDTVDGVASRGNAGVQDGDYAEYFLDLTASPGGYSVSRIDLYSNWGSGSGRDEIRVTIDYSLVGSPASFDQNIVNNEVYNPVSDDTVNTTQGKMSISGIDALGVAAIRFSWPTPQENGAVGYSELDVFGAAYTNTTPGPSVVSLNPQDGALGVAGTANLAITFNDTIQKGASGDVVIKQSGGAIFETIAVTNARISISGAVMTIDPAGAFSADTAYYVQIADGAIEDLAGDPWAGITNTDTTTWNFSTSVPGTPAGTTGIFDESINASNQLDIQIPESTLAPFKSAVLNAYDNNLGGVVDWETGVSVAANNSYAAKTLDGVAVTYGASGSNTMTIAFDRDMDLYTSDISGQVLVLSQQGVFHNALIAGGGNDPVGLQYTMTFSGADIVELGAAMPSRSTYGALGVDFRATVNYSGGGSAVTDFTIGGTKGTGDTFLHFAAPAGKTITSLTVAYMDDNGQGLANGQRRPTLDDLGFIVATPTGTLATWVSNPAFGLDPEEQGIGDDPDGDHIPNGVEAWFGTHPGESNAGLANLVSDGLTTTTFTHPLNEAPPSDISGFYTWSPDLIDWYPGNGVDGPDGGPTLLISVDAAGTNATVTAEASASLERLFLRAGAQQN